MYGPYGDYPADARFVGLSGSPWWDGSVLSRTERLPPDKFLSNEWNWLTANSFVSVHRSLILNQE